MHSNCKKEFLPYVNLATYQFVEISNPLVLREKLLHLCRSLNLKGTILLSREGINVAVAGLNEDIQKLRDFLSQEIPGRDCSKLSYSRVQPFKRLLVKVKREIIPMGLTEINPAKKTAKYLSPKELKRWIDEKREMILLDTRNDYEVKLGTFRDSQQLGIKHFRHFPQKFSQTLAGSEQKTIVMFCTGGIRCEKAGALALEYGFKNVYQLDGGILRYFEECGGEHYEGVCFVFDHRGAVKPDLTPG